MDDVMKAASGPHFSGLRLDYLRLSSSATPSSPPSAKAAAVDDDSSPEFPKQPFLIGVSGGTASGKTTVCNMIIQQLHDHRVVLVNQDSFYRGLTTSEAECANDYNFDHPDAFDTEQLLECIGKLKNGHFVNVPIYDFKKHRRSENFRKVNASDVIILEGILVFHDSQVRNLMDMKIFVDTDADIRLARRIRRDTVERGRDVISVLEQYRKFVKPAFDDFVLPSKKYADVIIPRGGDNHVAIDLIVQHLRTKLGQHDLCKIYPNVYIIQSTFQIRGMHTLIRDREITTPDFVFYSDRLIRLVVEHGLGHLPFTEKQVVTPTGSAYTGVDFCKKLCGVSIIRSGESMENALRACCKGIKIGKILIHRDGDNGKQLIYQKLPNDISERHVLLLDPVLATGNSAKQAIELLIQKGVPENRIIFLNLISAPEGIHCVCKRFPSIKMVTSEIDAELNKEFRVIPGLGEFGDRYFEDLEHGKEEILTCVLRHKLPASFCRISCFLAGFGIESIGVCYGMNGNNLPPPNEVIGLYKSHNIGGIRLYAPNQDAFQALRGSNIEVIIDVGIDVASLASDPSVAFAWVHSNIQPFSQDVNFHYIAVGNELIPGPQAQNILPAMQNMRNALQSVGLQDKIKVSTSVSTVVLGNSYPPSAGAFSSDALPHLQPIIGFLTATGAPLLANVHPYFAYSGNLNIVSLDYALFTSPGPVVFDGQLQYQNLFDGIVDALYAALEKAGGNSVPIVVSESGWPSDGGVGATMQNAQTYVSNLMRHVGQGTPRRPGSFIDTFLFAMFDENMKQPQGTENHFGLFNPAKQPKYSLSF